MWIKTIIFIIAGIAAIILLLLGVGLVTVVLVWFWNYGRYHGRELFRKVLVFARLAEKELEGDVQYGVRRVKKTLEETKKSPSLRETVRSYCISVGKIINRFFTKNYRKEQKDNTKINDVEHR